MIAPLALVGVLLAAAQTHDSPLLNEPFSYSDGLITNEYAYWNPSAAAAKASSVWEVTSGSLFASSGRGWTGAPDDRNPDAASTSSTGSAVFRATTRQSDFLNVAVSFKLLNRGLTTTGTTPAVAWDGCHIFLRYQSQYHLYYASVNRRDNTVAIKKKVPGGSSNGGTYHDLSRGARYAVPYGAWQDVKATVNTNDDGSVTINLYADGRILVSATDNGTVGGPPIRAAGRVGIRADNAQLMFDDLSVTGVRGLGSTSPDAVRDADAKAAEKFLSPALADGINDSATFGPAAQRVSIYSALGLRVYDAERAGSNLAWNGRDGSGRLVASGVYIARIKKTDGTYCYQNFAVAK